MTILNELELLQLKALAVGVQCIIRSVLSGRSSCQDDISLNVCCHFVSDVGAPSDTSCRAIFNKSSSFLMGICVSIKDATAISICHTKTRYQVLPLYLAMLQACQPLRNIDQQQQPMCTCMS